MAVEMAFRAVTTLKTRERGGGQLLDQTAELKDKEKQVAAAMDSGRWGRALSVVDEAVVMRDCWQRTGSGREQSNSAARDRVPSDPLTNSGRTCCPGTSGAGPTGSCCEPRYHQVAVVPRGYCRKRWGQPWSC